MLQQIGPADSVPGWVDARLATRQKIIGFGHRDYPNGDPRVPPLLAATSSVASDRVASTGFATAGALMEALWQRKRLRPNLDFTSAVAYGLLGLDPSLFTPVFLAARVAGLAAHIMEQIADNTLVHPDYAYCGEPERRFTECLGMSASRLEDRNLPVFLRITLPLAGMNALTQAAPDGDVGDRACAGGAFRAVCG